MFYDLKYFFTDRREMGYLLYFMRNGFRNEAIHHIIITQFSVWFVKWNRLTITTSIFLSQ